MYRLEDLAALEQNEITSLCQEFMNPGLVQLLKLIHFDRQFVKAKGSVLTSDDGTEYLDLLGSYGAVALGHNYPLIIEALISTLLADPPMMFQAGLNRYAAALASNLAEVAHGKLRNSFFCNSGTEAVEGALKAARAATGRRTLISVENSFHGKTMGALSMTGKAKYQDPFGPLVGDCYSVPFGDIDALERHLSSRNVAGFIVEPVLGEGGVILHPFKDHEKIETSYLWQAQHLCNKYGTMFILDEIQTGFGRTGTLFAAERFGLEPDIMCLAKALGGALMPIGVTMTTPKVWDKAFGGTEKCLLHTSTFGGNTLSMAAGIATLNEIIDQDLPAQAAKKGEDFLTSLRFLAAKYPMIKEVRGLGLLIGIEFNSDDLIGKAAYDFIGSLVVGELFNRFHIVTAYTLNNPTVVRFEPALNIEIEKLDYVVDSLDQVLKANKSNWKLLGSTVRNFISR